MGEPGKRGPRPIEPSSAGDGPSPRERPAARAVEGTIREALPNAMYSVELSDGHRVLGHIAPSLQTSTVRVIPGDRVTIELSPYDPMRGRITQRHR